MDQIKLIKIKQILLSAYDAILAQSICSSEQVQGFDLELILS